MTEPTKIVKGGFRATLALIISIIAIIVSIVAYSSSVKDEGLNAQLENLKTTMGRMKTESAGQLDKLRNETAQTLDKMSNALKIEEKSKNATGETSQGARKSPSRSSFGTDSWRRFAQKTSWAVARNGHMRK